jgi:hypothetical protein
MADNSTQVDKYLVKKTTSYDPDEGTSKTLKKSRNKLRSAAYAPRSSKTAKAYKKSLDEATGW